MKPLFAILPFCLSLASPSLHAASGTWTANANGDWTDPANWNNNAGPIADGAGFTATFGNTITDHRTVSLNGDRTIGNITASDTSHNYTISGANILTLDATSGKPVIHVTTSGRTLAIGATGNPTIGIQGNDGLEKSGAGNLILNPLSTTSTFSGDITISSGTLQIGDNAQANIRLGAATYAGNILNHGTLLLRQPSNQEFTGIISGSGTFHQGGGGTITLSGANTYTGKTIIAAIGAGGPGLSVSSLNSVNGGVPLMTSSSLGAPATVENGTIQLGSTGNIRSATLTYTGPGETTDRVMDVRFNSSSKHTIRNTGGGFLDFTSNFIVAAGSGTTASSLSLGGSGSGQIAEIGTIPGIFQKLDSGTWIIRHAVNTTPSSAPVNVNAGTLILRKGGFGHTGTTTVAADAALIHYASGDSPLLIAGPLAITGGTHTTIGASIGSTAQSARIDVAGNATSTVAAVKLHLYGNPFSTAADGSETYTLIQGGGTNTLNNATWSLGTVFNATQFTVGAITKSPDAVTAEITQVPALGTAYWKGTATAGITKIWAASNGSSVSNWSATDGGAAQSLVPGATTDVIFSSTVPAVAPVNTTLGADMSIHSLTIADTTNGLTLLASPTDSYGLTLGSGGITMAAGVPASSIAAPVILGGDQTWNNASANALTLSGPVTGNGHLTKTGGGAVNLTGLHSFTGNISVNAGTLSLSRPTLAAQTVIRVESGAILNLDFTGTNPVSYLIVNGTALPAGVYNAANAAPYLTGTGSITVTITDTDVDGIPDWWMTQYFGHPTGEENDLSRTLDDAEPDGLTNLLEFQLGTNPIVADTDMDGLADGAEVHTHGTQPLIADTDGDGLTDGAEVNTHGTSPLLADTDADGLRDADEITIHTTNPLLADTDHDNAGDWYEIFATFTDPKLASSKPKIPYPLPQPDNTPPATHKPVKVFVLMGQSNMQGKGAINPITTPGTLARIVKGENKFPNLLDSNGNWAVRNDVQYRGVISCIGKAGLGVGQGTAATQIGPELGFGAVMGYHFDEPVIVIKASFGGQDLGFDFLAPGSERFTTGGKTYGGYLDTARSWTEGTAPPPAHIPGTPIGYLANPVGGASNYGGKMFDDCVAQVNGILSNFATEYPAYAAQGYQIAGIGWFQGFNDTVTTHFPGRYESNLAHFISAFRTAINAPAAPFVIAACGFEGYAASGNTLTVINAQFAVSDPMKYPAFDGNVKTMETRDYWRLAANSPAPTGQGYHYNHNSETMMLVGDAIARGMIDLLGTSPGSAYSTWADGPFLNNLSDETADFDFDGGGLETGIEWVVGGDPTDGSDDAGLAPTADNSDPDEFVFSFRRRDAAAADAATSIVAEYSSSLAPDSWTGAVHGTDGITIDASAVPAPGFRTVVVRIPKTLADPGGKLFARLKVVVTP